MRINKFLAECGIASRRASDQLIIDGVVKINGKIAKLGDEVNFDDSVTVNNKPVNTVKKYDYYNRILHFTDNTEIKIDDIWEIEGTIFPQITE